MSNYTGEVVYIYAYDIAYEMMREPVRHLCGQAVAEFVVDPRKRNPRQFVFYRPQMVRLPTVERLGPHGLVPIERSIKLLPVGAISIMVRIPFSVGDITELIPYHDLRLNTGSLNDEVRHLAEEVRLELAPCLSKPLDRLVEEEAYTVFCMDSGLPEVRAHGLSAEQWMQKNLRPVASLLTQEADLDALSEQEIAAVTSKHLSYYGQDLLVMDWDAALLIDEPRHFEESLYVLELANLQLAELEAYDRILDTALERAYRDLRHQQFRSRGEILRELREIRIDMARFSDELSNITKFFGDWHLARIYESISARFHLADWHHTINEKSRTLDDLYQILNQDRSNRWMLMLEVTIVLLFVIDLVILFTGLGR